LGCRCLPSVNTICGRVMIGLSLLSSVSKHNMCLLTDDNNNKPNHNTTTYCVYRRTTTTINPVIIRPHIVFTDGRQQQLNHNTTTLLSSVSKHNMWSYYDWVYCCCCPSVKTICVRLMIELSLLSSVSKHNINPIIIRPHIVFTDGRKQE
jgi:hypothetical protein